MYMQAYSHLTKWKDLEKASTCNIGDETNPKLEQLWKDSYCQVYVHLQLQSTSLFIFLPIGTLFAICPLFKVKAMVHG